MSSVRGIYRPRLRAGADVQFSLDGAVIRYRSRECTLAFPPEARKTMKAFFNGLRLGGRSLAELTEQFPEIEDHVEAVLLELDALRMITETRFAETPDVISGRQLYRDVYRIAERLKQRFGKSRFYTLLKNSSASQQQLVGYVLEYYWLVRAAPGLIAPALAAAGTQAEKKILEEFLTSELGHDTFLSAALGSVGVDIDQLEFLQPLPTTFSICAALGVFGKQHPLSFKAVLFLFEQTQSDFVITFERRCAELKLPAGFTAPLREHANLNEGADHEAISARLLDLVPAVDREEQTVVKRNAAIMVETMIRQEDEILAYYGDLRHRCPRVFS
jgi:hypothetical protein